MSIKKTETKEKEVEIKVSATTRPTEEPKKRTPEESESITIQKSSFDELVKKINDLEDKQKQPQPTQGMTAEDVALIVSKTVAAAQQSNSGERVWRPVDVGPEDLIPVESAISFFAPTAGYAIVDDKRNNLDVYPPINEAIWFDYSGEERVDTTNGPVLNVFSQYVSRSHVEVEWLRNHRFYNILFFENMSKALDMDYRVMKLLYKTMSSVDAMEPNMVRDYLKAAGINPSTNHEMNKKELAFDIARKGRDEIAKERKSMKMPGGELDEFDLLGLEPKLKSAQ